MARKDDFHEIHTHCVMCGELMPPDRPRMAITCSDLCKTRRRNFRRSRQDQRACRYCQHPSTPEQRLAYQRWRRKPQDPEEEERYRLWRLSEVVAERNKSRNENKHVRQDEPEGEDAHA